MKHYLSTMVCCLFSLLALAQPKTEDEVKEFIWGANDIHSKNTQIPEKWQDESAVILYKENFYDYHKFAKKIDYTTFQRQRIILLDKAAVEDHSEFSFSKKLTVHGSHGVWLNRRKSKIFFGVKIIKPDGSVKEIQVDEEAVKTDDYFKLAIPGLEVGDILDYYAYSIKSFKQHFSYTFEPITSVLNEEYPIKQMKLRFNTENDFFVNFRSYNGAPELKQIETGKRNDRRYVLEAGNLEKNDFPLWYYPLKELPYFKFKVTFARKGKFEKKIFDFLPDDESEVKRVVTPSEIMDLYRREWRTKVSNHRLNDAKKFNEKGSSQRELVTDAFYFCRHFYLTQFIERSVLAEAEIISPYYIPGSDGYGQYFYAEEDLSLMSEFLKKQNIPFDLVVVTPRHEGDIEDILYHKEASQFLLAHLEDGPIYIPALDYNAVPDQLGFEFENTMAYSLSFKNGKKTVEDVSRIQTPKSSYHNNMVSEETKVSLNKGFNGFTIEKKSTYQGNSKIGAQKSRMYYYDFIYEDYKKFENSDHTEKAVSKKNKERVRKEGKALVSKHREMQEEQYLERAQDEYSVNLDDYSFKIINTGRYGKNDPLVFEEEFNINNEFVKKAGPNYILEISKLIGGQINVTKEDRFRFNDIYMNYPRSFVNHIVLELPDGYSISGLDKLNKRIENKAGGFLSEAKIIDDNKLDITVKKYYKNYFESQENWPEMYAFLKAAKDFTQEKILLKRGNGNSR